MRKITFLFVLAGCGCKTSCAAKFFSKPNQIEPPRPSAAATPNSPPTVTVSDNGKGEVELKVVKAYPDQKQVVITVKPCGTLQQAAMEISTPQRLVKIYASLSRLNSYPMSVYMVETDDIRYTRSDEYEEIVLERADALLQKYWEELKIPLLFTRDLTERCAAKKVPKALDEVQ